ncbi:radical SAM/SPASM domain-containing protein [Pseudoalteromonas gelatinilytica]|uniref:Radical SAM protein n=1 Tax=Pseudoalteromonas gelatinilytica TaxID=1703256 RepID=A0A3A3EE95_9GAMM|nr:radical SAM/SPASM domain-containing protein [Pseudoalteromonas profundi]RJF32543.1 radical SAM protein [Pseudoalteromonas profundi]
MKFKFKYSADTLTILPTYKCTAACNECCFESNPNLKTRLSYSDIVNTIKQAKIAFRSLKLVVFSGGECFTLKDDLYDAIKFANREGLKTRCVTNGYWGKSFENALKVAKKIKQSGLNEINFSTGLDHQEYVPESSIINVAKACTKQGIYSLIMVEKDTNHSNCYKNLINNKDIKTLINKKLLQVQCNTWMPFRKNYSDRGIQTNERLLETGCRQIFSNVVITPHGRVSACCGLTFEHIPELKIGSIFEEKGLENAYNSQFDDFLKIWIKVDGPYKIIKKLMGDRYIEENLGSISHVCQACVFLHKKKEIVEKLKADYKSHLPTILLKAKSEIEANKISIKGI